jgi:hypothetical protein
VDKKDTNQDALPPNQEYYFQQFECVPAMAEKALEKKISFFQYVLLVSSSILGIVVSLHQSNSPNQNIRLVFVFAVASLALGILTAGITLYNLSMTPERGRQKYISEVLSAVKEKRKLRNVVAGKTVFYKFFGTISLCSLSLGLILLTIYAVINAI